MPLLAFCTHVAVYDFMIAVSFKISNLPVTVEVRSPVGNPNKVSGLNRASTSHPLLSCASVVVKRKVSPYSEMEPSEIVRGRYSLTISEGSKIGRAHV